MCISALPPLTDPERVASLPDFWQIFEEWADVPGPEYEAIYVLRFEIDSIDLPTVGVDHLAITGLQAVHEPFAVKGWDVCFVAG
jgi:hypothetical protein